jgi:hypothetical protein
VTQIEPFTGALFLIDTEALTQSGFQCSVVFDYRSLPLARCVLVRENTVTISIQPTSAPKSATLHILGVGYRTFPYSFEDKYIVPPELWGSWLESYRLRPKVGSPTATLSLHPATFLSYRLISGSSYLSSNVSRHLQSPVFSYDNDLCLASSSFSGPFGLYVCSILTVHSLLCLAEISSRLPILGL